MDGTDPGMSEPAPKRENQDVTAQPAAVKPRSSWIARFANFASRYDNFMFGVADWMLSVCGVYVCGALISEINEKNLTLGIALIAIPTALASSCFGYARALDSSCEGRGRIVFAGK